MSKLRLLQLPLLFLALTSQASAQFAHTDHKQILDAAGKPLLVRATNLGNWLVPEGYMWLFQGGPQSPSEIRALVMELLGPEGSAAFWQKWLMANSCMWIGGYTRLALAARVWCALGHCGEVIFRSTCLAC